MINSLKTIYFPVNGVDVDGRPINGTMSFASTLGTQGVGTPSYMAPEIIRGDARDLFKADVFAWAIMANQILNDGRSPFARKPAVATMVDIANGLSVLFFVLILTFGTGITLCRSSS